MEPRRSDGQRVAAESALDLVRVDNSDAEENASWRSWWTRQITDFERLDLAAEQQKSMEDVRHDWRV